MQDNSYLNLINFQVSFYFEINLIQIIIISHCNSSLNLFNAN